ncbi:BRF1-domain-containing protein [Daedalea quercina L-15889]|uniref:B-related factor 1 n=1 Tax=Daedalea quercina L-15889 TaxID=1314783 RepID=A0A165LJY2_9APHY|nr:BRF1-domain-containing protein [Daedalea quercina L-15889]
MTVCTDCGGTVIEYDTAAGNGFCVQCGTVVEENTIVSEVTFGETSTGAAMVQGSFVAQGATRARMGGPFGNRGSSESREQTIANASRKIQQVASALRLSEVVALAATRLYTLAVEHKFTKGRKSLNVVAVCLYVACRQKETRNYMLIDFSDLLQVNVFELGHTYLQLVQTLNLRLPLVDPSHYISRFAALLEFGDETHQVAMDAVRLVQRFDRDWMTRGRRPAGICGACLLLAARMNNFRRSVAEIVQVVKIADTTLKKRLEEFRKTPSGALTLQDFRNVWLEDEMDPPAFTKGREKEEKERELRESGGVVQEKAKGKNKGKGKKRKRKRGEDSDEEEAENESEPQPAEFAPLPFSQFDPNLLHQGIFGDPTQLHFTGAPPASYADSLHAHFPAPTFNPFSGPPQPSDMSAINPSQPPPPQGPLFLPEDGEGPNSNIDPSLLVSQAAPNTIQADTLSNLPPDTELAQPPPPLDETVDAAVAEEVADFLKNAQGSVLNSALDEAEQRRQAQFAGDDELLGLDEEELDRFILTEEEVRVKERVWVEINKDYLEAIAAKQEQQGSEEAKEKKNRKKRKTNNKPRDASTPHGSTVAESVKNLIKKNPRYSKRINYDALKDLFTDGGSDPRLPATLGPDDKDDVPLYVMDDKSDGEGMLVVEEIGGGGVGMAPARSRSTSSAPRQVVVGAVAEPDEDEDAPGEDDVDEEVSEKGDDYNDWDAYEQEV